MAEDQPPMHADEHGSGESIQAADPASAKGQSPSRQRISSLRAASVFIRVHRRFFFSVIPHRSQ
jgi:hypothetical protein